MAYTTETDVVLERFRELSAIPRPSKKEQRVGGWLREVAETNSWLFRSDEAGNIVIRVPGTEGRQNESPVILQGHQDMVCEKKPDIDHDFEKEGITPVVEGEWLTAEGTTLGADNGIAIAIALALAADSSVSRPPLELLFTVDEETGLTGALQLDSSLLSGRTLVNIDSEEEGVLTVGCAGGADVRIRWKRSREKPPKGAAPWRVTVSGLRGGHSGVDIAEKRANANFVLGRALTRIVRRDSVYLVSLEGGNAHNAIPRDAHAILWTRAKKQEEICRELNETLRREYGEREQHAVVTMEPEPSAKRKGISPKDSRRLIDMLCALPHGVAVMSPDIPGLVETSSNLATTSLRKGKLEVGVSVRSSNDAGLEGLIERISAIAHLAGANVAIENRYPGWQPDLESPLLEKCRTVYREIFGADPKVEAIHAGLECGVIGSKFEGMDMISMGPTIQNPHSPDERLYLPSVERIYKFLKELLQTRLT